MTATPATISRTASPAYSTPLPVPPISRQRVEKASFPIKAPLSANVELLSMNSRPLGADRRRRVLMIFPTGQPSCVAGIMRYAESAGWSIDGMAQREELLPTGWAGDGVLVHFTCLREVDRQLEEFLERAECPVVGFGESAPASRLPVVKPDHAATARVAADYFLSRGYRRFVCLHGSLSLPAHHARSSAFRDYLELHGCECSSFEWDWASFHGERCRDRLRTVLSSVDNPVAIWATTDHLAAHAIETAVAMDLRVPDDVAVLGCDNDTIAGTFSKVPISTIDILEHAGYEGAALLDRMMEGERIPVGPVLVSPSDALSRASSDFIAISSAPVAAAMKYLRQHWNEPVRATDISRAVGVSVGGLFTAFRREIRKSPMSVLLEMRLREAERMLAASDDKLEFIAVTCGFKTKSNFSRVFKKVRGINPCVWRSQLWQQRGSPRSPR